MAAAGAERRPVGRSVRVAAVGDVDPVRPDPDRRLVHELVDLQPEHARVRRRSGAPASCGRACSPGRTGSTRNSVRSPSTTSSTGVGAAGPDSRQPSPAPNGCARSAGCDVARAQAASTAGASAPRAGRVRVRSSQAVSMVVVAERVGRRQPAEEAEVGGQPEDRGVVERGDQGAAGGLPGRAVHDHLAEHRVVRRADLLPGLQGGVDAGARRPADELGRPACGRKPLKASSA